MKKTMIEWLVNVQTNADTYSASFKTEKARDEYFKKILKIMKGKTNKVIDVVGYQVNSRCISAIWKNHIKYNKTIFGWFHNG